MNKARAEVGDAAETPLGTEALLQLGYASLGRKEIETGLSYFAQVLVREPDRVDLLNDCGGIYGLLRRYDEAVGFFQRALLLQPERADVLNNLGLTLGMLGRHQEAIGYLSRALAAQPDYFDVLCNLGHSLNQMGRHAEALECLERATGIRSGHAGAQGNRGVALAALNRHVEALQAFKDALRVDARHVNALVGGACSLLSLKRDEEALEWLDRALRADPGHTAAMGYRSMALLRVGREAEAVECLERALFLAPDPARTLHDQARLLQAAGKHAEALQRIERALGLVPGLLEAVLTRGVILVELNRSEEALRCFDEILLSDAKNLVALNNRAVALGKLKKDPLALVSLDEALATRPDDYCSLINRGITLTRLQRWEEALESFEHALRVRPESLEALINRAATLFDMFRLTEARECLEPILQRDPENADALNTMGAILWHQNRNVEAREYLQRALALKPGHVNAINNLSFLDLAEGHLLEGFAAQEIRWQTAAFSAHRRTSSAPLWLGEQSLDRRTILVQHEQGFGDTLQFIRYARLLAERGARVIVSAPAPLRQILAAVHGVSAVIVDGDPLPAHDFRCPLMSLPLAFATTMETIPGGVPYIHADPERVAEWRVRLGPARRPRIGLVWAGRQFPPLNVPRDMSLSLLLPLLELDAEFISLQKEVPVGDQELLGSLSLARLGESLTDFADTAALIECLDLLISVDTSGPHLAAAMGRPTWIMNRLGSCWRWLRDGRTDSPWYPSVRLFRQAELGDWEGVVIEVKRAAELFIEGWSPAATAAMRSNPPSSAYLMRRAAELAGQGDAAGAIDCYTQILSADPEHPEALAALGRQLGEAGFHAEALVCFDKALARSPETFEVLSNRGAALTALGQEAEALTSFDKALALEAGDLPTRCNRGVALLRLGRHRDALGCFDEVLQVDRENADARLSRSIAQLTLGNYREGFRELEKCRETASRSKGRWSRSPLWQGKESLEGKTVLLHEDVDVASTIFLARYIPHVAAQAGKVLLDVTAELRGLLRSSFVHLPCVEVLPGAPELPAHDCHCPLLSLPLAFDTRLETIPGQVPYLRLEAQKVQAWQARLGGGAGRRLQVGLVWRERRVMRPGQGVELSDLLPLLECAVDFVILQPDCTESEKVLLERFPHVRLHEEESVRDVADQAALIANLDVVISIDLALGHLAGALAKPVFLLLTPAASWHWMEERSDSPWYPSARLFRRSDGVPLSTVVTELAAAVRARASAIVPGGAASRDPIRDVQQAARAFIAGSAARGDGG